MADAFRQHFGCSYEEMRAELQADEALSASFRNPNISSRRDNCRHGAPESTEQRVLATMEFLQLTDGAQTAEQLLVGTAVWARRHRSAVKRDETARIVNCMAADAVLAEDWACARPLAHQAAALRVLCGGVACDRAELERFMEWRGISNWAVRRVVARAAGCGCLGRLAEANCAFPGCGAVHDPDVAGGATLRGCSRCKGMFYCCPEHQHADWGRHKKAECTKKTPSA